MPSQNPNLRSHSSRSGFTLIELLVVIAIIAILAAILFPVFAQAKTAAKAAASLSNMKQIITSEKIYIGDFDDAYPTIYTTNPAAAGFPGGTTNPDSQDGGCAPKLGWFVANGGWVVPIQPYTKNGEIFVAPYADKPFWLPGGVAPQGWCTEAQADPTYLAAIKRAAPQGVAYLTRKAVGGAGWFNGGPIIETSVALPAQNLIHFEFASWSRNRNITTRVPFPTAKTSDFAITTVFFDGHAAKIIGGRFRQLRPEYTGLGWGRPATTGTDFDWFLTQNTDPTQVGNSSSPANDTKDID